MTTAKTPPPSGKPAKRSRTRAANAGSDFAMRTAKAEVATTPPDASHQAADTRHAGASNEELGREIVGLKTRIRALNATNLNLRRRIAELEARDTAAKPLKPI